MKTIIKNGMVVSPAETYKADILIDGEQIRCIGRNLADEEARAADTELKVLEDVLSMYKELEREGMGELGTQALIKYYNW